MKTSAFNPEMPHDHDMCAGCQDGGDKMHHMMTKHAKEPHGRGFHKMPSGKGKMGKGLEPMHGGGEGMASNEKGAKKTGKTMEPMESHGEY